MSWQKGAQLLGISRLRAFAPAALAAIVILSIQSPAPAAAASPKTAADRVIAYAMAERGRPWVYGAAGPSAFDCSGLVLFAYRRANELPVIGNGHYRSGSALLRWARLHHLTTTHGQRGDVAVWGNGSHVGIYLGHGTVISTLLNGVRVTGVRALTVRFTTFIHTGLAGTSPARVHVASTKAVAKAKIVAHRRVTATTLNLRAGPGRSSRIVGVVHLGLRLGVLRSARDASGHTWYRVAVGSHTAWVAGWLTRAAP